MTLSVTCTGATAPWSTGDWPSTRPWSRRPCRGTRYASPCPSTAALRHLRGRRAARRHAHRVDRLQPVGPRPGAVAPTAGARPDARVAAHALRPAAGPRAGPALHLEVLEPRPAVLVVDGSPWRHSNPAPPSTAGRVTARPGWSPSADGTSTPSCGPSSTWPTGRVGTRRCLVELRVRNLGVIDDVTVALGPGHDGPHGGDGRRQDPAGRGPRACSSADGPTGRGPGRRDEALVEGRFVDRGRGEDGDRDDPGPVGGRGAAPGPGSTAGWPRSAPWPRPRRTSSSCTASTSTGRWSSRGPARALDRFGAIDPSMDAARAPAGRPAPRGGRAGWRRPAAGPGGRPPRASRSPRSRRPASTDVEEDAPAARWRRTAWPPRPPTATRRPRRPPSRPWPVGAGGCRRPAGRRLGRPGRPGAARPAGVPAPDGDGRAGPTWPPSSATSSRPGRTTRAASRTCGPVGSCSTSWSGSTVTPWPTCSPSPRGRARLAALERRGPGRGPRRRDRDGPRRWPRPRRRSPAPGVRPRPRTGGRDRGHPARAGHAVRPCRGRRRGRGAAATT